MSSQGMLKIQKITFVARFFFYPRDVCLIHLSKTIFCTCFGVKSQVVVKCLFPGAMRDVRCRAMLPDSTVHVDVMSVFSRNDALFRKGGQFYKEGFVLFDPTMH